MRLLTSEEMRAADNHAIKTIGIPSLILMENAGLKILFTLEKALKGLQGKRFTIVCGKGNNGGDGLVVARHLLNNGVPVSVFLTNDPTSLSEDATTNYKILCSCGLEPVVIDGADSLNRLRVAMEFSDCLIDGVFGTGIKGNITGFSADVIRTMNECRAKKVAIDIPSGLDSSNGIASDPCFKADMTITLGAPKLGMFLFPGRDFTGEVWTADIGIPFASFEAAGSTHYLLSGSIAASCLPTRKNNFHKGNCGHALLLAGSKQYQGAGVIASYGALRSGAGLISLGLPETVKRDLSCQVLPDVILTGFSEEKGNFALKSDELQSFSGKYSAIVAGPGWGRGKSQKESLKSLITAWAGPLLLDADALNQIDDLNELSHHDGRIPVLTPHIGEMSRLTNKTVAEIQDDLPGCAREFAKQNKCIVVLKSAVTVIADPDGRVFVSSRPNSGLSRGGSGDLLAGLVGGFLAQGIPAINACLLGVYIHAEAGELARQDLGEDSMTITEVSSYIPKAFKALRGEE